MADSVLQVAAVGATPCCVVAGAVPPDAWFSAASQPAVGQTVAEALLPAAVSKCYLYCCHAKPANMWHKSVQVTVLFSYSNSNYILYYGFHCSYLIQHIIVNEGHGAYRYSLENMATNSLTISWFHELASK
jgi:hypothetical protein